MQQISDLKKLRHLVAVAEAGSITGAANALGLSQSAITKSVAEVEHLLELKLFDRLPRGVRPTETGAKFVEGAIRLLDDAEELTRSLGDLQSLSRGRLRIGVGPASFIGFLEHALGAFTRVYPGVRVIVREGTIEAVAEDALSGHLDIVVGSLRHLQPWTDLAVEEIARFTSFFIARPAHPLNDLAKPSGRDVLSYPIVLPHAGLTTARDLERAYEDAGIAPRAPHYECDHFPLVKQIVKSTDALSPVVVLDPQNAAFDREFSVFRDLVKLPPFGLGIATPRGRTVNPATAAFRDIFKNFIADAAI